LNDINNPGVSGQVSARDCGGNDHSAGVVAPFRFCADGLFLVGCSAYALNRWVLKPRIHSRFLHGHFNDLWLIPCALPPLLWLHRKLGIRSGLPPSALEIAGHLCLWSLLFEWIGPKFWSRATADPWDVLCYWVGGTLAWLWWHRVAVYHWIAGG
jgi:hypothetical protein